MDCSSLTVTHTEEYIGYTFNEKALAILEFKMLMNLNQGDVLPAYQIKKNGSTQLLYLIPSGSHTLGSLAYSLEPDMLLHVLTAIDKICSGIEDNGFLKFEHLDMHLDHMVLNIRTGGFQMVYLPVNLGGETAILGKDNVLRELFRKLVSYSSGVEEAGLRQLRMDLEDGRLGLRQIMERVHAGTYGEKRYFDREDIPAGESSRQRLPGAAPYLVILENQVRLEVNKARYLIGKNLDMVDGVIYNHNTVSRMHCAILTEDGCCYIQDLNSKNGTFINEQYVSAGSKVRLHNGDRIRLAECNLIFYEG